MRALVWFRSDLRVDDNTALAEACERADRGVVGVFLVSPSQWRAHGWGDMKAAFTLRNVRALSERLAGLNVALLVRVVDRFDGAPAALLAIAREHGCDELFFNAEHEVNEAARDEAVREAFDEAGLRVRVRQDQTIVPPREIKTNDGGFYSVFTPFRKRWAAVLAEAGGPDVRSAPSRRSSMVGAPEDVPEEIDGFDLSRDREDLWPAGEEAALGRLGAFIRWRIEAYKDDRDPPAAEGTSRLSAYLSSGVISPRRCLVASMEANGGAFDDFKGGAGTWISELVWREFYKHVLVGYPRVCRGSAFRKETDRVSWREDAEALEAWRAGRTGVPIVDAGMRQLLDEGWMHNRVRMIAAMFLTKDLLIDWREGERHFARHLVDLDFASNNGGWQWSASTGTDAAPYFRIFNPYSQSRRFDPEGAYIRAHVPELAEVGAGSLHEEGGIPDLVRSAIGYPGPIVEHARGRARALEAFEGIS